MLVNFLVVLVFFIDGITFLKHANGYCMVLAFSVMVLCTAYFVHRNCVATLKIKCAMAAAYSVQSE